MKKIAILLFLLIFIQSLTAEDSNSIKSTGEALLQVSSLLEVKLEYTHDFTFPFLQGNNPLTENNNIRLSLTGEISPISLNGIANTIWTPIAFLEFSAGIRLGAGWPIHFFGSDIYGTGLNLSGIDGKAVYSGSPFDALLWKVHAGGMFQFDLAAIFPGDWNHVVTLSYHEINYHANTRAKAGQPWFYENDDGENINGFNYYGNFLIGYQMPIFLNMIAFLTEMELYLYDTPGRSSWGDDLIRWHFSGILNFKINEQFDIALICQFRTLRNFTEETKNNHYQSRILDTSSPLRLEFYRIAAMLTFKF
jgi:hypothetical protein